MTGLLPQCPMIIGHRGARGERPENTLEGIRHAFSVGCDMVEIDVQLTRDGVAVVVHDATLNPDLTRTEGGAWVDLPIAIGSLTASDVTRYNIGKARPGSATARRFPDQLPLPGAQIPSLPEVLALTRETSGRLLIELKNDPDVDPGGQLAAALSARAAADVAAASLADRVVFQSFDWRILRHLRGIIPETELSALSCKKEIGPPGNVFKGSPWLDGYAEVALASGVSSAVAAAGWDYWAPNAADLDGRELSNAQAHGLRILAWTVNDPVEIDQVCDAKVFGIITDVPSRVRSRLSMRGL